MKIVILCYVAILMLFGGCKSDVKEIYFPQHRVIELDSAAIPKDSMTMYFPMRDMAIIVDSNNKISKMNEYTAIVASKYLYELKEPILSAKYLGKDIYRANVYDQYPPRTIRLIKENDSIQVIIKYGNLKQMVPLSPCSLANMKSFKINLCYWDSLDNMARLTRLWEPPLYENAKYVMLPYFYIEGHRKSGYAILGNSAIDRLGNYTDALKFFELFCRIEKMAPQKVK